LSRNNRGSVEALELALERWGLELAHAAFLNARPFSDGRWRDTLICEQPLRPGFLELEKLGYRAHTKLPDGAWQNVLMLAGRNRRQNEANLARAWNACESGGSLVVAGEKTAGIAPLRRAMGQLGTVTAIAKYHASVLHLIRQGPNLKVPALCRTVDGYQVCEGMFSSAGPDKASRLLCEYFSDRIHGKVADLGAGWGYLSRELLTRSANVSGLDLYEADWLSLEAAKDNIRDDRATFHWVDVTMELPRQPYDWVIMNPPFHSDRKAEPELGQAFIGAAASILPKGGRLLMVANKNLPYEKTLTRVFRSMKPLKESAGFKIIEALR